MSLQVNQAKVDAAVIKSQKEVKQKKQQPEEKQQLKEHCSSKAAKALRGMVLGLALTAGITGCAKVPVNTANSAPAENKTTISQESEANVQKSDVEMMVDDLLEKSEGHSTTLHVGDKNTCHGKMTMDPIFGGRDYDMARITKGGSLVFYNEITVKTGEDSHRTEYIPVNSFDLQTQAEGKSINLTTGSRYEESSKLNGDYVELAEDGRTFNVFDVDGKKIGHVKADTPESHRTKFIIGASAVGALGAGYIAFKRKEDC